ncbi:MAG: hypothetical protein IK104_02500 [Clostridia bacterium]|nr:hypothetical protein [Clostridia bacterium]
MSKPMKKGVKVFLILLIAATLLTACFICVGIYAKMEFEKERTWLPPVPIAQQPSATELPDNAHDAYEYAMRLYREAVRSDRAEGSWYTDVDLGGDMELPFAEADNVLINDIRREAAGAVQALYPTVWGVKMSNEASEEIPVIDLKESDILEYPYDAGSVYNRKGEYRSDVYELVFKVDPAFEDAAALHESSVYKGICDALKDAVTVDSAELEVLEVELRFRVDRLTDQLQSVELSRLYNVAATVTFTDAYSAVVRDTGERQITVTMPYRATQHIIFMWYGLHFTKDYLEQKPNDMVALPLDVYVNFAAVQGEDFRLEYEISDPETLEIDKDAVLTVHKTNAVSDTEGIRVTAKLYYDGKVFQDDLIIFISEKDKTATGVRFWQDGYTMAVGGNEEPLPVEIRVPVNEQADNKAEEEYELLIEISDPEALSVEVDGKDLYATALKAAADPVTVSVTMKCGGHTYYAELPVTITQAKEAADNG